MFFGCSERKEGSEYTGAIRVSALEEEGVEGRLGLRRQKHKCSPGVERVGPSEKALETKLKGWVFI